MFHVNQTAEITSSLTSLMADTDNLFLQAVIVLFTLALFYAINKYPRQLISKLRSKTRSKAQTHRHFVNAAQLLSRARSTKNRVKSHKLADDAVSEAEKLLAIDGGDAASHILKGLALDLMGRRSAAIECFDAALSAPAVRSLGKRERGDALFKRAEMVVAVKGGRRVESAVVDLVEAVRLVPENGKAFGLLGECYEIRGEKDAAKKAFVEAVRLEPGLDSARQGLARLGS
jgi:tetratricopeptide (TPR) repeat protein